MIVRRCFVFALIAGVAGAFIGRASPHGAPSVQAAPSASTANRVAAPAGRGCKEERADLASTKAQLAICMAFRTPEPEAVPSGIAEGVPPEHPEYKRSKVRLPSVEESERNRELLDSYSEAVIVQHRDGRAGIYKPDEWPIDGDSDGYIVARKLPSGKIGWYAGPDAGPRSDPAAFRVPDPPNIQRSVWGVEPDGTITINGKPASPSVQFIFGGKIDRPANPQR
jgi:hypothetical protein